MQPEHVPVIPSNATRIRLGSTIICVDAAGAQAVLERLPSLREKGVEAECGPDLLHVGGNVAVGWSAWSDGRILVGCMLPVSEWPARLAAVDERLIHFFMEASCRQEELDPRLWMRWLDATDCSQEVVRSASDERAFAADHYASRIIELRCYSLRFVDRPDERVWVLRESVATAAYAPFRSVDGHSPTDKGVMQRDRRLRMYTDEAEALARFASRDDGRPPIVTVQEGAPLLGTTEAALREALSRADDVNQRTAYVTGRTHWYVLEHLAEWHGASTL
ncbi:hypothetical protein ACIRP3_23200 [Streptomyces sp. NPDC101209]|uniref:hypothetical protein n=1 Tax=Streptomyces sp. NPDC101209 TaxID=3366129 RepID=UPI00380382D6